MLRIATFIMVFLAFLSFANAQDFDDYKPVQCSGKIPKDFLGLFSDKYKQSQARIDKNSASKDYQDDFLLKSNFKISEMMQSGKVLFGDSSTIYINKVADKLLASKPEMRKKLRFYVLKSPYVNAFATDEGIIFVSYGLLARLQTEAQLAFILAHESIHFFHQHAMTAYVEKEEAKSDIKYWQKKSAEEFVMKRHAFSREQEIEADNEGLELFLESEYSTESVIGVFDILLNADLPFDQQPFDRTFLNNSFLEIPPKLFGDSTSLPSRDENYDDSESTHPNIATRKKAIQEQLANTQAAKKDEYLVSEKKFNEIREIARFEVAALYISTRQYQKAIFHSFLLQKKYPESKYLKKITAQALYGLARYREAGRTQEVILSDSTDGHLKIMPQFHKKTSSSENLVLAMTYVRDLIKSYPDDLSLQMMLWDLTYKYEDIYKKFSEETDTTGVYAKNASDKLLTDSLFQKEYLQKIQEQGKAEWKSERKRVHALGINKILVVNPFHISVNNQERKMLYLTSEDKEVEMYKRIQKVSRQVRLSTILLGAKRFRNSDVRRFNNMTLLTEWVKENSLHEDLDFVNFYPQKFRQLSKFYRTKYVAWIGALGLHQSPISKKFNLGGYTVFYVTLYDLQYGRPHFVVQRALPYKDRDDILTAMLYDTFSQIKSKKVRNGWWNTFGLSKN